ncbi:Zinc-binding domain of primase-helicase [Gilliamella apicola SCGC AB-598-I20]|nr:Zinc-binding domain of primase-helicase [Gilliamella apicola SCGC AB-598-I20]
MGNGKHYPSSIFGGKDRFWFDNKNGYGTYSCNLCGSGDGLELIKTIIIIFVELNFCYKSSLNLTKELVIQVFEFISPMKLSIKQIPFQPTNLITESVYNLIVLPCSLSSGSSGV